MYRCSGSGSNTGVWGEQVVERQYATGTKQQVGVYVFALCCCICGKLQRCSLCLHRSETFWRSAISESVTGGMQTAVGTSKANYNKGATV